MGELLSTPIVEAFSNVSDSVVLSLSNAWLGVGLVRPATTEKPLVDAATTAALLRTKSETISNPVTTEKPLVDDATTAALSKITGKTISVESKTIDRYDYKKLWSVRVGDYFMPLSQTFVLRAKKRLNVSSLVDGIDIIQQTRKEAKTIECTLRLTLRDNQPDLTIQRFDNGIAPKNTVSPLDPVATTNATEAIQTLSRFLQEFYERDRVFEIENEMINNTFRVRHVILSDYRFTPKTGAGTFIFEFSLTEVIYGNDILTFDERELVPVDAIY